MLAVRGSTRAPGAAARQPAGNGRHNGGEVGVCRQRCRRRGNPQRGPGPVGTRALQFALRRCCLHVRWPAGQGRQGWAGGLVQSRVLSRPPGSKRCSKTWRGVAAYHCRGAPAAARRPQGTQGPTLLLVQALQASWLQRRISGVRKPVIRWGGGGDVSTRDMRISSWLQLPPGAASASAHCRHRQHAQPSATAICVIGVRSSRALTLAELSVSTASLLGFAEEPHVGRRARRARHYAAMHAAGRGLSRPG